MLEVRRTCSHLPLLSDSSLGSTSTSDSSLNGKRTEENLLQELKKNETRQEFAPQISFSWSQTANWQQRKCLLCCWAGLGEGNTEGELLVVGFFFLFILFLFRFLEVKDVWEGSGRDQLRKCLAFLRKTANPRQEVPNNTPTCTGYFYGAYWWLV